MDNGFIFFSELTMFGWSQYEQLLDAFSDNDYVFLSDAYNDNAYLIIINSHDNFEDKKPYIFRTLDEIKYDNVELEMVWYDKQDYDYIYNISDNINIDELYHSNDKYKTERLIVAWLEYRNKCGDWDDVCERCFRNNKYIYDALVGDNTGTFYDDIEVCDLDEEDKKPQEAPDEAPDEAPAGYEFNPLYGNNYAEACRHDYTLYNVNRDDAQEKHDIQPEKNLDVKPVKHEVSVRKITIL